jgi:MarR family transcriptional regulator, 2-MHQ and catechol-resistance regulon repressor
MTTIVSSASDAVATQSARSPKLLRQDAADLYDAATAFIRIYQFRDRDRALALELTVVQAYALDILLSADGQSLSQLAQALRLDKSTTSRIVAGMTRRGMAEWSRREDDRRAKRIVASAEGKRRYGRLRQTIVRDNARLLASYPAAARRNAISILWQLVGRVTGVAAASESRGGGRRAR